MRRRCEWGAVWRATGILLVALALAVRLVTPTGWMLASGDSAPKLIICTGHAPAAPAKRDPAQPVRADHACAFAGSHVGASLPLLPPTTERKPAIQAAIVASSVSDQRPGQGLAAPPPPSQGPPVSA